MSQPRYKLTYFDAKGIVEPVRIIFAYAGIEYKDVRLPVIAFTEENVAKLKETYPLSLPTLEIDGEIYSQLSAITAYLAEKYGLSAENEYDKFRMHECHDDFRDFFDKWKPLLFDGFPEEKKVALKKKLLEEDTIQLMSKYNPILVQNNDNGSPWLFGNKMTWIDISVAHFLDNFKQNLVRVDLAKGFPAFDELCQNVYNHPRIKEYIEKRPDTPF